MEENVSLESAISRLNLTAKTGANMVDIPKQLHVNNNNNSKGSLENVVQTVLGAEAELLTLPEFLHTKVKTPIPLQLEESLTAKYPELQYTLINPLETFSPLIKLKFPLVRHQSLSSLVDDIVWVLVQRRERRKATSRSASSSSSLKKSDKQHRNLLCTGYIIADKYRQKSKTSDRTTASASNAAALPTGSKAPLAVLHINTCVDYCKTSQWMEVLHECVGDDIMRSLLLHCSLFVPILESGCQQQQSFHKNGNYLQITGPPTHVPIKQTRTNNHNMSKRKSQSRKQKRKRSQLPQKPEMLHPRATISRKSLFYSNSYLPSVGLPSNHILNHSPTPEELLKEMLCMSSNKQKRKACFRKRWKRVRVHGITLSQRIIHGHASCDYHRLLERHCPLPEKIIMIKNVKNKNANNDDKIPEIGIEDFSCAYSTHEQVMSFLTSVIGRVFPLEFWGSAENRQHFFDSALTVFVRLRRQEAIPNKTLLHGLRLTKVQWLCHKNNNERGAKSSMSRTSHHVVEQLFLTTLRWLIGQYVIPLLSSIFHVTETEFGGKRVMFYRKPVWSLFRTLSIKKLLHNQQYTEVSGEETLRRLMRQQMGLSRLRLLPKATGVRPIATLCKREKIRFSNADVLMSSPEYQSNLEILRDVPNKKRRLNSSIVSSVYHPSVLPTNTVLSEAFSILRCEHTKDATSFGTGLDGLYYFYPKYRRFLLEWKSSSSSGLSRSPLLFGSVDIHHCYDNINQEYLLQMLDKILVHNDYLIQRFGTVYPFSSLGQVFVKQKCEAGSPDEFTTFSQVISRLSASQYRRTIFFDSKGTVLVKKREIMGLLREHLTSHLVVSRGRYGNRFFVQSSGIPQGSVLSTLLCNLYYAQVERLMLGDLLDQSKQLLVRMVDDFMICTTDAAGLRSFLSTMLRGNDSLGVVVNDEKTKVSAEICIDNGTIYEPCSEASQTRQFPWCGMLFNIDSGEVMIDYSRYRNGNGGDNLTVDRCGGEGTHLFFQMKSFVRPRCIPILFDSSINTWTTQVSNFYQLMVFAAVKTTEHIESASIVENLVRNASFLVNCVRSTTVYAYGLIQERLARTKHDSEGSNRPPTCTLKRDIAEYLGWRAFGDVFGYVPHFVELHSIILQNTVHLEGTSSTRTQFIVDAAFRVMNVKQMFSV